MPEVYNLVPFNCDYKSKYEAVTAFNNGATFLRVGWATIDSPDMPMTRHDIPPLSEVRIRYSKLRRAVISRVGQDHSLPTPAKPARPAKTPGSQGQQDPQVSEASGSLTLTSPRPQLPPLAERLSEAAFKITRDPSFQWEGQFEQSVRGSDRWERVMEKRTIKGIGLRARYANEPTSQGAVLFAIEIRKSNNKTLYKLNHVPSGLVLPIELRAVNGTVIRRPSVKRVVALVSLMAVSPDFLRIWGQAIPPTGPERQAALESYTKARDLLNQTRVE